MLLAGLLAPLTVAAPAQAALTSVGPVDAANGYPKWFGDETGLRLQACLDPNDPLCLGPMAAPYDPAEGPVSFPDNYPEEAFYWTGDASMAGPNGLDAQLVMAQEMAFDTGDGLPAADHQIVFGRIRIRVGGLQTGTYTVTHPYGAETFTVTDASEARDINFTDDQGCLVAPCGNFATATNNRIGPFLTWAGAPAPPAGYVGDPSVPHAVTGSPFNTNFFRIEGPGLPAGGVTTTDFLISGKKAPALAADAEGVSFGGVVVGSASAERTITLSNVQAPALTISDVAISGTEAADFAVTSNTCSAAMTQDGTCTLGVTFTPGALDARNASLVITHDQLGSPLSMPLDGRGLPADNAPAAEVTPASLTFGDVQPQWIFTSSEPQDVTVSNATGTAPLEIFGVSLTGADARHFKVTGDTCTGLVPAGQSCSMAVAFEPQDAGPSGAATQVKNASLSISHDAGALPSEVALVGTAQRGMKAVGPLNADGFPESYTDSNDVTVEPCLDPADTLCLPQAPPFDPANGPMSLASGNYPEEAFYWSGEASFVDQATGVDALLVMAQEMAFDTPDGSPALDHQAVFGRLRIRVSGLGAGKYTVTHPYGVDTFEISDTAEARDINFTDDRGCLFAPCGDFSQALNTRIGPLLKWDPRVGPAAPQGYLGDPNVPHAVTGSPLGTNVFKIEGPGLPAGGLSTDQFLISGKLTGTPPPAVPQVSLNPTGLDFGNQTVGSTSPDSAVTVTNSGDADLHIGGLTVTGADFGLAGPGTSCSATTTLAPQASCTVAVRFAPTQQGPLQGQIVITDDAVGSPHTVALTGTGTVPAPVAAISPTALTFAQQTVGTTSPAQTVTVSNSGDADLEVSGAVAGGDFSVASNGCGTVAAGGSCTIGVSFTPKAEGARSGALTISHNAAGNTSTVSLSGTGALAPTGAPAVTLSATTLDLGAVKANGRASTKAALTVTNSGTAALNIASASIEGSNGFSITRNRCTAAITPGRSCKIEVGFSTSSPGVKTDTLLISSNAATSPERVSLTARGR